LNGDAFKIVLREIERGQTARVDLRNPDLNTVAAFATEEALETVVRI
jgi:hypothetical protein